MKNKFRFIIAFCAVMLSSCTKVEIYENTPTGNFEALWNIIDEHYCFFDYKAEEYGLDWDAVYRKYKRKIADGMSTAGLFEVLGDMLDELRDGHVNLYAAHDVARYWDFREGYATNFSEEIQARYLGTDYKIASGLRYTILPDNIGYIYIPSFSNGIGEGNLDECLYALALCRGLIIDVRNNGGGNLSYAETLAARFTNERVLTGYISHKTGSGRSDFSSPQPVYLESSNGIRWQKPVCVLTNRSSYSATNDFVKIMRILPLVTIVGDRTGGGSGLPFSSELPNGWSIRFSACPSFDVNMQHTEFGIDPDVRVDMSGEDRARGVDTIIETARAIITGL
ncbi:MAG: S41 family peptidase [Bacteroidaceae bacterium]|nr:S41 family peptidase [Bacteroidaceae bacterium]